MSFTKLEPTGVNTSATFSFSNINMSGTSNLGPVGNVIITGGTNGYVLSTNGSGSLSWVAQTGGGGGSYSNANVAAYLPTYTGNVSAAYFSGDGSLLSSITGGNVTGQVSNSLVAGTVYTQAQPNITSVGTLTTLNVSGNSTSSYFIGNGSSLTNLTGGNVTGQVSNSLVAGTVYTNSQPNITSVGTLSGLTINGSITGNIVPSANLTYNLGSSTNRFKDLYLSGTTIYLGAVSIADSGGNLSVPGLSVTSGGISVTGASDITGNLNVSENAIITGNLTVNGNYTYVNIDTLKVEDPIIELGGGPNGAALTSNDGKDRGSLLHYYTSKPVDAFIGWDTSNGEFALSSNVTLTNDVATFNEFGNVRAKYYIGNGSTLTNITGGNVDGQVGNALVASTVYTNSQPNITSVGTLSSLTVTGLVTATGGGVKTSNIIDSGGTNTISVSSTTTGIVGNLNVGTGGLGNLVVTNNITGQVLISTNSLANEGGEIQLSLPSSGSTLSNGVVIDVYQNKVRIFESGGTNRGGYIDLTAASSGVGSNLLAGGGTTSPAGSNTNIQFNDAGSFGGSANLSFDKFSNTLSVTNLTTANLSKIAYVQETFSSITGATGNTTHNLANGAIFYHTSISANFTANFTNFDTTVTKATTLTLVLVQGSTAYNCTGMIINNATQTVLWPSATIPSVTANGTDILQFVVFNNSGTYKVIGAQTSYS